MNRYDENYSAYFAAPDEDYPVGSAVDSTSEDNLDGTPYLAAFFNDVVGFMQAVFFGVFGKDAKVSNKPETCRKSDVWEAIQKFVKDTVKELKDAVYALIPVQATAENQLADKDFVNSSIATNTAYFIGTFDSLEELEAYAGEKTNNDYAFVRETDEAGNTLYKRYKWNGSEWLFEYELNNSSFTAEQWAAVNSGATAGKISQIKQMEGASSEAAGEGGLVPAPAPGDENKFLAGDGTWKRLTNPAIDSAWPIGITYTQYPQQEAPADLFPGTTWEIISYDGAFFRAEGGNAAAFIEKSGVLSVQAGQNQRHTHSITHSHSIKDPGHFHGVQTGSQDSRNEGLNDHGYSYETNNKTTSSTTGITVNSFTGDSASSGGDEARPANFTVRIWKRTA